MADDKTPKPKVPDKADDKEQSERFIQTAREHSAASDRDALERALKKLLPQKKRF